MTLFDTSVVIDARDAGSPWHEWAKQAIADANDADGAAVNTIVMAEAAVRVLERDQFPARLEKMGLTRMAVS